MRIAYDELASNEHEDVVSVYVAHFEWEERRVVACLDASDVEFAEMDAPGGHGISYLVRASSAQRALRALEYAGLLPPQPEYAGRHAAHL